MTGLGLLHLFMNHRVHDADAAVCGKCGGDLFVAFVEMESIVLCGFLEICMLHLVDDFESVKLDYANPFNDF